MQVSLAETKFTGTVSDDGAVFETTEISLVAMLQCLGHKVTGVNKTHSKARASFMLDNCGQLQRDVLIWLNNEPVKIRTREFLNNVRNLKGMVG